MIELNKVIFVGCLTRDPEIKYLPSGMAIANLAVALNRRFKDRQSGEAKVETTFVEVTAWDKHAEFAKNYLSRGRAIYIEGRLKQDKWTDKETGQTRSKLSVVAERIQFADKRKDGREEDEGAAPAPAPAPRRAGMDTPNGPDGAARAVAGAKAGNVEDDSLPF